MISLAIAVPKFSLIVLSYVSVSKLSVLLSKFELWLIDTIFLLDLNLIFTVELAVNLKIVVFPFLSLDIGILFKLVSIFKI